MIRLITVLAVVAVFATGCAAPELSLPCRFTLDILIDKREGVTKECQAKGVVYDGTTRKVTGQDSRGCATANWLVAEPSTYVYGHEMNHAVLKNCRKLGGGK